MGETSRNLTSKLPENQAPHLLSFGKIWIHSFDVPFKTTHSHNESLLSVFSESLQKVENGSNLMHKSEKNFVHVNHFGNRHKPRIIQTSLTGFRSLINSRNLESVHYNSMRLGAGAYTSGHRARGGVHPASKGHIETNDHTRSHSLLSTI